MPMHTIFEEAKNKLKSVRSDLSVRSRSSFSSVRGSLSGVKGSFSGLTGRPRLVDTRNRFRDLIGRDDLPGGTPEDGQNGNGNGAAAAQVAGAIPALPTVAVTSTEGKFSDLLAGAGDALPAADASVQAASSTNIARLSIGGY